jgi:hypothetical protein
LLHCFEKNGILESSGNPFFIVKLFIDFHIVVSKKSTFYKRKITPTSMLALMGARLDKNIDFETIRETAEKANSYT